MQQTPMRPEAVRRRAPVRRQRRRRSRVMRFVRGYLMLVGGLTTLYWLVILLVRLFVGINNWMPGQPPM